MKKEKKADLSVTKVLCIVRITNETTALNNNPSIFFFCIWDNDYILRTWTRTGQMKHLEKAEAINQRESQHIPGVHVGFMMLLLLLLFCKTVNLKNLLKTIIINMHFLS